MTPIVWMNHTAGERRRQGRLNGAGGPVSWGGVNKGKWRIPGSWLPGGVKQ